MRNIIITVIKVILLVITTFMMVLSKLKTEQESIAARMLSRTNCKKEGPGN